MNELIEELTICCCSGNYELLQRLLNDNANKLNPKINMFKLLLHSITYNNIECVKVIMNQLFINDIKKVENLELFHRIYCEYCINDSIECGNINVFNLILDIADINCIDVNGSTPLMLCCRKGKLDFIKLCIEKGADINRKDYFGSTAIFLAAMIGSNECVSYLCDQGADVSICNLEGESVLFYSTLHGNHHTSELLLNKYPDLLFKRDSGNRTPLHFAVSRCYSKCVNLFIDRCIDINSKDNEGYSPIHCSRSIESLEVLIEKGCDINSKDNNNCTALHLFCLQKKTKENEKKISILLDNNAIIDENAISSYTVTIRKLLKTELKNRRMKVLFDIITNNFIEYDPYKIQLYKICYPIDYKKKMPLIGWSQALKQRDIYYQYEVLHLLQMHVANVYSKLHSKLSSQLISISRNSNKIYTLMRIFSTYIKVFITIYEK